MNSITCTICKTHNCWDYKIKDSEMDRGHKARGRREKCWRYFTDACEGKKLFVRTRCTLDIILKRVLNGSYIAHWILLFSVIDSWRIFVNMTVNCRIPQKKINFLTNWTPLPSVQKCTVVWSGLHNGRTKGLTLITSWKDIFPAECREEMRAAWPLTWRTLHTNNYSHRYTSHRTVQLSQCTPWGHTGDCRSNSTRY